VRDQCSTVVYLQFLMYVPQVVSNRVEGDAEQESGFFLVQPFDEKFTNVSLTGSKRIIREYIGMTRPPFAPLGWDCELPNRRARGRLRVL
jgi:hypothetical protein